MADPQSSPTAASPPVVAAQQSPSPMKSPNKLSSYTVSEKKAILKKVEKFKEKFGTVLKRLVQRLEFHTHYF